MNDRFRFIHVTPANVHELLDLEDEGGLVDYDPHAMMRGTLNGIAISLLFFWAPLLLWAWT